MPTLTVAFCTFRRADRLDRLVAALRAQACPVPFEILAVDNASPDDTLDVLARLQTLPGAPLRVVTERAPGIVPARNRALSEALDRDILVFIDDDELPEPGLLQATYQAIAPTLKLFLTQKPHLLRQSVNASHTLSLGRLPAPCSCMTAINVQCAALIHGRGNRPSQKPSDRTNHPHLHS